MPEPTPQIVTRSVPQRGVWLPWEEWTPAKVRNADGLDLTPERPDPPQMTGSGEVFVSMADLEAVAEQGRWDSNFGTALALGNHCAALALVAAGWAVRETGGGLYGTDALRAWMNATGGYDFEMAGDDES
jgi:hypothetical protein